METKTMTAQTDYAQTPDLSRCPYCDGSDFYKDDFEHGPLDATCVACESRAHKWAAPDPWVWVMGATVREAYAELASTTYRPGTPEGDL